jgi:sigma-B regulation protein RsbU (phosphoserine phosphatase)
MSLTQSQRALVLDFGLCCSAGIVINSYNKIVSDVPLSSVASLMIGCVIAGFFIGLDSSLAQERTVILQAKARDIFSSPPGRLFPMTRKFTFVAVTTSVLVSLVLILVFNRDIVWLSQTVQDAQSIHAAQLSVIREVFFIMAVLMVLIVNLIFSYSRNLKLLFDNETRVLEQVRQGDLSAKVPVATYDEFGIIAEHTNHMIDGLRHRFELITSLKLAEEVQQNLLPRHSPLHENFEISGTSIYCDETGGDYYDYFLLPEDKIGIAVADSCGHGIGAAMLMISVRAFLTAAVADYRSPAQLLQVINRYVTRDCSKSGRFTTMFFLEINPKRSELKWVRAGHEPAVVFHAASQSFSQLVGAGLVLGVDDDFIFKDNTTSTCLTGDIILVGTDGIYETRNTNNEMFGPERLQKSIREHAHNSARIIQEALIKEIDAFRGAAAQEDDITLVVIKLV